MGCDGRNSLDNIGSVVFTADNYALSPPVTSSSPHYWNSSVIQSSGNERLGSRLSLRSTLTVFHRLCHSQDIQLMCIVKQPVELWFRNSPRILKFTPPVPTISEITGYRDLVKPARCYLWKIYHSVLFFAVCFIVGLFHLNLDIQLVLVHLWLSSIE